MGGITSMEDLILILVLSGIGLVTLLVSVWLFYRKKRKTTEKKQQKRETGKPCRKIRYCTAFVYCSSAFEIQGT